MFNKRKELIILRDAKKSTVIYGVFDSDYRLHNAKLILCKNRGLGKIDESLFKEIRMTVNAIHGGERGRS